MYVSLLVRGGISHACYVTSCCNHYSNAVYWMLYSVAAWQPWWKFWKDLYPSPVWQSETAIWIYVIISCPNRGWWSSLTVILCVYMCLWKWACQMMFSLLKTCSAYSLFLRSSVEIRKCGIVLEIFNPLIRFYLPLSVMANSTRLDNHVFFPNTCLLYLNDFDFLP